MQTLKKRSDFLALRGAKGKGAPGFLLVARPRGDGIYCDEENGRCNPA